MWSLTLQRVAGPRLAGWQAGGQKGSPRSLERVPVLRKWVLLLARRPVTQPVFSDLSFGPPRRSPAFGVPTAALPCSWKPSGVHCPRLTLQIGDSPMGTLTLVPCRDQDC